MSKSECNSSDITSRSRDRALWVKDDALLQRHYHFPLVAKVRCSVAPKSRCGASETLGD
jgi:hypothetical protein